MAQNQNDTRCIHNNGPTVNPIGALGTQERRKKNLSEEERVCIVNFLLLRWENGKLKKNSISGAAAQFNVSVWCISRVWNRCKASIASESTYIDTSSRKKGNSGRKRKNWDAEFSSIPSISLNRRGTLRSLSFASKIPKTTLVCMLKEGELQCISSTVKPTLTDANKIQRLKFSLSFIEPNGLFHDMFDYVHIDEKWFYLTKIKQCYYLTAEEQDPHRNCKSKRYITKVMFMAAVGRPQYDTHRKCYFDGKIGLWPFVTREPAQRSSKNRPRGTLVTKAMKSVDKMKIKEMISEKIMPAIREKMPICHKTRPIFIQQDNAKPHTAVEDTFLVEEGKKDGWDIRMHNQPPNSPDFNVLDLVFF